MANDIDVGVGIKVTGDPSGAEQVEQAIREVGEASQEVSRQTSAAATAAADTSKLAADAASDSAKATQAIADNIQKLTDLKLQGPKKEVDDLNGSLLNLSNEKIKSGVDGVAGALNGLLSGDVQGGLLGLSKSVMALAGAIPLPGAAEALGFAALAIGKVWESLKDKTGETLNAMGETVKAEFARIKAVAEQDIQIAGLQNASKDIEEEFGKVNKLTETVGDSLRKVFNSAYSFQIASLKEQLDAAGLGATQQEQLQKQIDRMSKEQELVNNTLALDRLKKQLENNLEIAKLEQDAIQRRLAAADASIAEVAAMRSAAAQAGVSKDALYDSGASESLRAEEIRNLQDKIDSLAYRVGGSDNPFSMGGGAFQASPEKTDQWKLEMDGLERLKTQLLNFNALAQREADALAYKAEGMGADQDKIEAILADSVKTSADIGEARGKLTQALAGVGSDVIAKAQGVAENISRYEETAAMEIEARIANGDAVDAIVRDVVAKAEAATAGVNDKSATLAASIDQAKALIEQKMADAESVQQAIDSAPQGADTSAKVAELNALFEEIAALEQQIAAAPASANADRVEADQKAAADQQKKSADALGSAYVSAGTKVGTGMDAASVAIAEGAEGLSPEPIVDATQGIIDATENLGDVAAEKGAGIQLLADEFKLTLRGASDNWKDGASSLVQAAQDNARISLQLAQLTRQNAEAIRSIADDIRSIDADISTIFSQIRNMR